jgi:hypothetical protein
MNKYGVPSYFRVNGERKRNPEYCKLERKEHKENHNIYCRIWRSLNHDKVLVSQRQSHLKRRNMIKLEIYSLLGEKCVICGYQGTALQIDHVNNDGERRNSASYYYHVLKEIKDGSKRFQLLCANCNWEKEILRRKNK